MKDVGSILAAILFVMFFAQDDYADHCRQQKKAGHLQGEHVLGEETVTEALDTL